MTPRRRHSQRMGSVEMYRFRASSLRPVPVPPCPRNSLPTRVSDHAPASWARYIGWSQSLYEAGSGVIDIDDTTVPKASPETNTWRPGVAARRDGRGRPSSMYQLYFTSTVAPASVNFFLMVSASSLETPSLIAFGAPSTKSLASFKPRLVTSRTALITLILLAPTSFRTTLNSVFSSAGAAPAAAPPPPAIITGAAAAAETPSFSSSRFTKAAASSSDSPTI